MKIIAHLKISTNGIAYYAAPFPALVAESCEDHNKRQFGPDYLSHDKLFAPVTVEFEVPDDFFKRVPLPVFPATPKI